MSGDQDSDGIEQLLHIMVRLRGENGCPWDREQTLDSLKKYLVEECYEVVDAIESGDPAHHEEELGDLLLQIVCQARIREEEGAFSFNDVARRICRKLVYRHPHVFGDTAVKDSDEVLRNWETLKAAEKSGPPRSSLGEIPRHLPALHKAHKVQTKAARVGFDWDAVHDVIAKIEEELREVTEAIRDGQSDRIKEEIGDLLFAVVNLSRFQKMDAEEALNHTVRKFVRRFEQVECAIRKQGRELTECTLEEMDAEWDAVKERERGGGGRTRNAERGMRKGDMESRHRCP